MNVKKAADHFIGRDDRQRYNCAQAVAAAFESENLFSQEDFESLRQCSSGRAPLGYCGSFYAARMAIDKIKPEHVEWAKEEFIKRTGSLHCREIRKRKLATCLECVESSAYLLKEILPK